jgi:hypothetical protein
MRIANILLVALIAATACTVSTSEASTSPASKRENRPHLMNPSKGAKILDQCSRETPKPGQSYFRPAAVQIVAFEKVLQVEIDKSGVTKNENEWRKSRNLPLRRTVNRDWQRDVVGLVRDGRRYIYGNYYPLDSGDFVETPVIVCDGGPMFFGAEYDIKAGKITHLAFNGRV